MCPGSHIRHARGATPGPGSPEVQVPGGPAVYGRGRLVQGCEQALGPQHQANRCSVVSRAHQEHPSGSAQCQLWGYGSAEPVRKGRRPASAGKESDACTRRAPRRRGGGTKARIGGSKQGRSGVQPTPDRMAKTRRITAETGSRREGSRLAAEAVRAMTARTTQPHSSKGPLGKRGRRFGKAGRSAACGYHAPGRSAGMAARLLVMSCGGGKGGMPTRHTPAT
jgi:hypothetical protein